MKNQRLLSLLLALCCLVTLLPFGTVSAYAAEPENTVKTLHVPCQVNPLYADILGDDAAVCVAPSAPAKVYGEINYIPESEVVPTVRQALVNREAVIEIHYKTAKDSGALTGKDLVAFFDEALVHTGEPKEGDYLQYTYSVRGEIGASISIDPNDGMTCVSLSFPMGYYTTAAQELKMDQAVDKLLAELNVYSGTDYQKVRAIYEYITKNVRYDNANLNNPNYTLKFSGYAALVNGTAVCQGYANLLYRLALELGVDARIISGTGNGGPHGWNIVKLGSKYYNLDATWDEGVAPTNFRYFLRSPNNFPDHSRDAKYVTTAFNNAYPMAATDYPVSAVKITTQPKNVTVAEGANARVTVIATGEGLTYKWYYKDAGTSKFYLTTSFTGDIYTVVMNSNRAGRQVYCVVTDKYGNSVTSNTVTLNMSSGVKITTQPKNVTVAEGANARVTVVATGEGLTYKWYYKNAGTSKFYLTTSFTGDTYAAAMNSNRAGRQIYCVVTDKYGNSVTSDTVTLSMK